MNRISYLLIASLALGPPCACKRASDSSLAPVVQDAPATPDTAGDGADPTVLDVVHDLDTCTFGHRGVLLDFGDPSMHGQLRPGSLSGGDDEVVEHGGATWLRVRARSLTAVFYWPPDVDDAPEANTYVEAKVRGLTARGVAVAIDGKHVGDWALAKGEVRTVTARGATPITLAPGGHELTLRFVGGSRTGDALAEIDWVHVGTGEAVAAYAAPTRAEVLTDPTVGGRSMRALALRSPGFVRCAGWIPANATIETSLATAGGGDADIEARLLRDRKPPVVLGAAHAAGGGSWAPWSVPITGLEGDGALCSIEIVVKRAGDATRVLLGAPRLVAARAKAAAPPPTARGVVLVVLGSTAAKSFALWGGPHEAKNLARLASSGTSFVANRASSTLATAVVGSMLTGLPPRALGLQDADARLPRGPTTVAEACRQAGIATAMFTSNPTTGAAFGFDRGWDSFVPHDPLEESPAVKVFDEAAAWIEAHKRDRFLVVIHARGGHPPWDATPEELKSTLPQGYLGILEPRRAAEALTKARKRPAHFKEEDRVRAWALYDRALDAHDEALGRLLAGLQAAGRDQDTAVIVTGDVGPSEGAIPFVDVDTLDETQLATPLVVRWPRGFLSDLRLDVPTGPDDLGRTMLGALGLVSPPTFQGVDLASAARGALVVSERPLAATLGGRFAIRWGPFVLVGAHDREARMCDLSLDPTCVADVRATSPLALEPLHRWALDALGPGAAQPFPREGAVLDQHVVAALVRWGVPTDDNEKEENEKDEKF